MAIKYPKLSPEIEEALIDLVRSTKIPVRFHYSSDGTIYWNDQGFPSEFEVPWPTTERRALVVLHEYAHCLDDPDMKLQEAYNVLLNDNKKLRAELTPREYIRILACEIRAWRRVARMMAENRWSFSKEAWIWAVGRWGLRAYWDGWKEFAHEFPLEAKWWTTLLFQEIEKVAPGFLLEPPIVNYFSEDLTSLESA